MTSGSDHYLGELTVENVAGPLRHERFMAAVHDADQPLTSLEFEAGTGDYGEDLTPAHQPETAELKTRLCLAQGNRLINYYLFAGGHNPPLDEPVGDGNDRIAFTGERHGFAAPIDPEGRRSPTYARRGATFAAVHGAEHLLADMDEEYDDVALGFVPDHYLTEYHHPARRRAPRRWSATSSGSAAWVRATSSPGRCCSAATRSRPSTCSADPSAPTWTRPACVALGQPADARPRDLRSGWPPSSRPADGCCCTAFCPTLDDDGTDVHGARRRARPAPPGPRVDGTPHHFPSVPAGPGGDERRGAGGLRSSRSSWPAANRCSPRSAAAGAVAATGRRRARAGRWCSPATTRATSRSGGRRWSRSACGRGCGTTGRPAWSRRPPWTASGSACCTCSTWRRRHEPALSYRDRPVLAGRRLRLDARAGLMLPYGIRVGDRATLVETTASWWPAPTARSCSGRPRRRRRRRAGDRAVLPLTAVTCACRRSPFHRDRPRAQPAARPLLTAPGCTKLT